jgi:ribonuclease P protein component
MTLTKEKRIRKRRDYLRVQRHGFRAFGRFIVAVAQKDKGKSGGRVGITVPKKVGRAHVRNKIKRRIRHVMRENQGLFFRKALVIVVRESIGNADFSEIKADIIETCKRLQTISAIRSHQHNGLKAVSSGV